MNVWVNEPRKDVLATRIDRGRASGNLEIEADAGDGVALAVNVGDVPRVCGDDLAIFDQNDMLCLLKISLS